MDSGRAWKGSSVLDGCFAREDRLEDRRIELGLAVDPRGRVLSDPERHIFCCGDTANGASLVVRAIADGRRVARALDESMRRKER